MGYNAALNIARLSPKNVRFISELQTLMVEEIEPIDWRRLWQTEQAMMLISLDSFTSKEGLQGFGLREIDNAAIRSKREMLRTKTSIVRLLIQAEKAWQGKPTSAEASIQISRSHEKAISELYANYHEIYVMLNVGDISNNFERLPKTLQSLEATRRLTWLALMTVKKGPVWQSPAETNLMAWSDPFSSVPMKFKAVKGGFKIYSIGPNKVDDGGTEGTNEDEKLDVVLSFPFRD